VFLYQKIGVRNQALQSTPDQQNYQEQKKKREGKSKGYLRKTRVFCGEIIMYIKKGKESYEPEKYCSSL